MNTVIVYASKLGSTRKVAEYIAGKIGSAAIDLKSDPNPDVSKFDKVIIGSGVYAGKPSKRVNTFIKGADLGGKDVRMFVCCMFNDEKGDRQLKQISDMTGFPAVYFSGKDRDVPSSAADSFVKEIS
jgi:menaquinone-dependent protoporphyrinogen oxidase